MSKQEEQPTTVYPNGTPTEPKPPRPYTEYNIFFQLEREHILQRGPDGNTPVAPENAEGPVAGDEKYNGLDMPSRYAKLVLQPSWHVSGQKTKKRKHRKSHGMVGFTELTKLISSRWSACEPGIKKYCKEMALIELARYKEAMEAYTAKWGKPIRTKKRAYTKRKSATAATAIKQEQAAPALATATATAAFCGPVGVATNQALHDHQLPSKKRKFMHSMHHHHMNMGPLQMQADWCMSTSDQQQTQQPQPQQSQHAPQHTNQHEIDQLDSFEAKLEDDELDKTVDLFLDSFKKEKGEAADHAIVDSHADEELSGLWGALAQNAQGNAPSASAPEPKTSTGPCERELALREREIALRERQLRVRELELQSQMMRQMKPMRPAGTPAGMSAVDRFWMTGL